MPHLDAHALQALHGRVDSLAIDVWGCGGGGGGDGNCYDTQLADEARAAAEGSVPSRVRVAESTASPLMWGGRKQLALLLMNIMFVIMHAAT